MTECMWTELIRPTQDDVEVISDELVKQLLEHNKSYQEFCRD